MGPQVGLGGPRATMWEQLHLESMSQGLGLAEGHRARPSGPRNDYLVCDKLVTNGFALVQNLTKLNGLVLQNITNDLRDSCYAREDSV
ncbi:hypothetical protein VTI28DRAFT_9424 [Corynascus sepedonium]